MLDSAYDVVIETPARSLELPRMSSLCKFRPRRQRTATQTERLSQLSVQYLNRSFLCYSRVLRYNYLVTIHRLRSY